MARPRTGKPRRKPMTVTLSPITVDRCHIATERFNINWSRIAEEAFNLYLDTVIDSALELADQTGEDVCFNLPPLTLNLKNGCSIQTDGVRRATMRAILAQNPEAQLDPDGLVVVQLRDVVAETVGLINE